MSENYDKIILGPNNPDEAANRASTVERINGMLNRNGYMGAKNAGIILHREDKPLEGIVELVLNPDADPALVSDFVSRIRPAFIRSDIKFALGKSGFVVLEGARNEIILSSKEPNPVLSLALLLHTFKDMIQIGKQKGVFAESSEIDGKIIITIADNAKRTSLLAFIEIIEEKVRKNPDLEFHWKDLDGPQLGESDGDLPAPTPPRTPTGPRTAGAAQELPRPEKKRVPAIGRFLEAAGIATESAETAAEMPGISKAKGRVA